MNRLRSLWRRAVTRLLYSWRFGHIGSGTVIFAPGLLSNTRFVWIGRKVLVRYGARIEVVRHGQSWEPRLEIGDNVNIEQNVHIVCHDTIRIGKNVSITGHCAIVDVTHPHEASREGRKIGDCVSPGRSSVVIGENAFLGFGVCVLPNVVIGKNCMIGAGSVVSRDIPDDCVAAGVPARVLRTFDAVGAQSRDSDS